MQDHQGTDHQYLYIKSLLIAATLTVVTNNRMLPIFTTSHTKINAYVSYYDNHKYRKEGLTRQFQKPLSTRGQKIFFITKKLLTVIEEDGNEEEYVPEIENVPIVPAVIFLDQEETEDPAILKEGNEDIM